MNLSIEKGRAILCSAYNTHVSSGEVMRPNNIASFNLSHHDKVFLLKAYIDKSKKEKKPLYSEIEIIHALISAQSGAL